MTVKPLLTDAAVCSYGYAPLHYAASMLHTATIRALVDCPNGANINTETHDGERAVHLVARR